MKAKSWQANIDVLPTHDQYRLTKCIFHDPVFSANEREQEALNQIQTPCIQLMASILMSHDTWALGLDKRLAQRISFHLIFKISSDSWDTLQGIKCFMLNFTLHY